MNDIMRPHDDTLSYSECAWLILGALLSTGIWGAIAVLCVLTEQGF